ncbi:MAG: DUF5813 family protein [Halobacteriaceae archaeon]
MTDLGAALAAAPSFEAVETGYAVSSATFEAVAVPGSETVTVTVEVPTIDAVVVGDVADVVVDGWYETLVRRLDGVTTATAATVAAPTVERLSEQVVVGMEVTPRPDHVAEDVVAVVNFVEGTWVGGIIPGYDYVDEIEGLRIQAAETGGTDTTRD